MTKVTGGGPLQQLERAHHQAGAHAQDVRAAASKFFDDVTYGSALKEPRLKLRLAVDPASREAMKELWHIVFQSQKSEGTRLDRLDGWMSTNKGLVGWMSAPAQAALRGLVAGKGDAHAIDAAIEKGERAVRAAFGAPSAEASKALDGLAHEAHTEGAVQAGFAERVSKLAGRMVTMLMPGAKAALDELRGALSDPNATNAERQQRLYAWEKQHPKLTDALDAGVLHSIHHDLSVADWSDGNYARARQAVLDAFSTAAA